MDDKFSRFGERRRPVATNGNDVELDKEKIRQWIEELMGVDVGGDNNENFFESLEDGVILCSIMNNFRPGLVDKINPAPKAAYKKLENLTNFSCCS